MSACGFIAVTVIFNCLAFWFGRVESLTTMLADFTLTFSLYPRPLFEGGIRILLFSAIPAAFVGWYPVEAVRHPGIAPTLITTAGGLGLVTAAVFVFNLGLRRYESGNRFGVSG
jgi:ABC-2 type transport system permease protein